MSVNPWEVHCIKDFLFLNCPECAFKTKVGDFFQDHATKNHPSSSAFYERNPLSCINTEDHVSIDLPKQIETIAEIVCFEDLGCVIIKWI